MLFIIKNHDRFNYIYLSNAQSFTIQVQEEERSEKAGNREKTAGETGMNEGLAPEL
jgi:hypothetical protein